MLNAEVTTVQPKALRNSVEGPWMPALGDVDFEGQVVLFWMPGRVRIIET